jgi:small conductance mechanosensitive channel
MNGAKELLENLGEYLKSAVLPVVLILVVGILVIRLVMRIVKKALEKSKLERAAHTLINTVTRIVLYVLLGLVAASRLGIDVTSIVALASVLTLAVSLAVQNILTNVMGGFTLLYTKPFSSGDFVEIAGQSGTVREIGLAYTQLSTPDNKSVYIPNSSVTAAEIVNYTVLGTRRVDITVSASYDTPVQLVLETLRQAGNVPTAQEDQAPVAAVDSYGDSAINYVLRVWCRSADYWDTKCAVMEQVKVLFDEKGVEMTYPHLNVHLNS